MADIVIRFTGDASGLASFYQSVGAQTDAFVNKIQKTYQGQFRDVLGLKTTRLPIIDPATNKQMRDVFGSKMFKTTGSDIRNISVEMDRLNDVIKVTGETGFRLANGSFFPVGTTSIVRGSVTELEKARKVIGQILTQRDLLQARYGNAKEILGAQRIAGLAAAGPAQVAKDAAEARRNQTRADRDALTQEIRDRQRLRRPGGTYAGLRGVAASSYDALTNRRITERNGLTARLARETSALAAAQARYNAMLADPRIAQYPAKLAAIEARQARELNRLRGGLNTARAAEAAVLSDTNVGLPVGYKQIPPQLLRQLKKGGLGAGPAGIGENLVNQNAEFNRAVYDMERGLIRLGGSYDQVIKTKYGDITATKQWNATVDEQGRVVQTSTRNLRGLSRLTQQISKDFQKVIEWTVATTVVFGALAAAGQGLQIIKEMDADLARLSLTANTTSEQTKVLYEGLVNVANITATPLEELVKAADDLALAVRRPGQTAQQLTSEITTLAEAVGIYTNLTGEDTVAATDELVAVMKQLGYTATEVYGILNKVTAAAGGQSGTISDITRALSVMAEAGEQANLTVDQQIGVIKTLSQVTSKSPAEIATAFKNLVGALENPAALKALKSYNIGLIKEGNSIIDIYTQIAEKIRTGAIAPNDVSGLLRAISGGPRRAPDAAALLANINTVLKETEVSANATNEAFVANAAVLDTLNAKMVQFQNVLKDKIFVTFGDIFKQAVETLLPLITQLLDKFSGINPQILIVLGGLVLLRAALGLTLRALRSIGIPGMFTGAITGASTLKKELLGVAAAAQLVAQATKAGGIGAGIKGGLALTNRGSIGAGLVGAGVGAALGAAGGGGLSQIAGGGLQGLGLALLTLPEPTMLTKIAGGIALIGGTFLSLQQEAGPTAEELDANAQAILNVHESAITAGKSLSDLATTQRDVKEQIAALEKATEKDPEQQALLNDLYSQYASNILASTDAQVQLNNAVSEFTTLTADLPGAEDFGERLRAAATGGANSEEVTRLIQQLQQDRLSSIFPGVDFTKGTPAVPIGTSSVPFGVVPGLAATAAKPGVLQPTGIYAGARESKLVDLDTLDDKGLKSLFSGDLGGGAREFNATLAITRTNIDAIQTAINNLPEGERGPFQQAFDIFKSNEVNDNIVKASYALDLYKSSFESLTGVLPADVSSQAAGLLETWTKINALGPGKTAESAEIFATNIESIQEALRRLFDTRQVIPVGGAQELAEAFVASLDPMNELVKGSEEYNEFVALIMEGIFGWSPAIDQATEAMTGLSDKAKETIASIRETTDGLLTDVASKSQEAFSQLLSGDISAKKYAKLTGGLKETAQAIREVRRSSIEAAKALDGDLEPSMEGVKKQLSKIPGLEDAMSLSTVQLIQRMFELADAYGVNAAGIDMLGGKMNKLFKAIRTIAGIEAKFQITGIVDLRNAIAGLKAMKAAMIAAGLNQGFNSIQIARIQGAIDSMEAATGRYTRAQNTLKGFGKSTRDIYSSGNGGGSGGSGGSGSGGSGSSGPGKDVSELDLPEEIADAPNRSALIREAIRRARALQRKIPGASKEGRNDIVELLKGTQRILEVRGVKDDLLRRALEELAEIEKKRLEQEQKADTIRRIRVGNGDFAAIANVPVNSRTGISLGGPEGPINITLNLNGTVLSPAQFQQFADQIAAALKRQISK